MIPIYVTRKTAHGETGSLSVSPAMYAIIMVLGVLNLVGWLAYALGLLVYLTVTAIF